MARTSVKFPKDEGTEFFAEVRSRVNSYFKENNISKYGDVRMVVKTIVLIMFYAAAYTLIITRVTDSYWGNLLLWMSLGLAIAGLGLSVMHDAVHGAYSKNKKWNKALGDIMLFIGGSAFTWNIQHNQLHHSYTNVDGLDEDIDPGAVMRFSPHKKRYWIHKFQHFYAWFFYGLMTLTWSIDKDFKQLYRYKKMNFFDNKRVSYTMRITRLVLAKIFFQSLTLVIPIIILPDAWYVTASYVFIMHFVAGLVLALVFQPAHVMPTSEYPLPDKEGSMENTWAIHQLLTTANFAPKSKLLSWYVGGLNFQIEHHLFPNICHVHHKAISDIVKKTAKEYNLPYNVQPTFIKAIWEHHKMLRWLGRVEYSPVSA